MIDIGIQLNRIMKEQKCSSLNAFRCIKESNYGIRTVQSESERQLGRRLRDKVDIRTNR